MPGFDGTGPRGLGPLTGRGLGRCGRAFVRIAGNRRIGWPLVGVAVISAAARDIRNPRGLLRRCVTYIGSNAKKALSERSVSGKGQKLQQTDYVEVPPENGKE